MIFLSFFLLSNIVFQLLLLQYLDLPVSLDALKANRTDNHEQTSVLLEAFLLLP